MMNVTVILMTVRRMSSSWHSTHTDDFTKHLWNIICPVVGTVLTLMTSLNTYGILYVQ